MRSICHQHKPALAETGCAPLLHFIWADIGDLIVARLQVPRQNLLIPHRLPLLVFLCRQTRHFAIGDSIEVVVSSDPGYHMPVLGMHDIIRIPVSILREIVINLFRSVSYRRIDSFFMLLTFVATIAAFNVSPWKLFGPNRHFRI